MLGVLKVKGWRDILRDREIRDEIGIDDTGVLWEVECDKEGKVLWSNFNGSINAT